MFARRLGRLAAAGALLAGGFGGLASTAGAAPPLAPAVTASAEASGGTFHPYSTLVLPDVIFGQMGVSHAEIDSAPRASGIAGPFYAPAAGLLGLLGLPKIPPQMLPYCQSYFPGDPESASCVGPRQENGGVSFTFANGQTASTGDFTDLSRLSSVASVRFGGAEGKEFSVLGGRTDAAVKSAEGRWTAETSLGMGHLTIGDVLTIDSIASSATGALNGTPGSGMGSRRLTVTGAKVGGQPVDITTDGVVVAGNAGMGAEQAKALQVSVDSALKQANLTVRLVPGGDVKVAPDGSSVVADSGGVVVAFNAPQPVPPASGFEMIFGRSVVRMSAYNPDAGQIGTATESGSSGMSMENGSELTSPKAESRSPSVSEPRSPGGFRSRASFDNGSDSRLASDPPAPESGPEGVAGLAGEQVPNVEAAVASVSPVPATATRAGAVPGDRPAVRLAIPAARSLPVRDNAGLGVRHVFLALGALAVVGPFAVFARRLRTVLGG